jgi:hypothetical protein
MGITTPVSIPYGKRAVQTIGAVQRKEFLHTEAFRRRRQHPLLLAEGVRLNQRFAVRYLVIGRLTFPHYKDVFTIFPNYTIFHKHQLN